VNRVISILMVLIAIECGHQTTTAQQIPYLAELISRIEQSSRLYREKRGSGIDVGKAEAQRKRGEEAFRQGNVPGLLEALAEGVCTLEGKQWDEKRRFISSLTIEVDRLVIEPNQPLHVSLSRMFPSGIDKVFSSPLTVSFEMIPRPVTGSGAMVTRKFPLTGALPLAEASTNAMSRRVLVPDGAYLIVARVETTGLVVAEITTPVYAISDYTDQINQFSKWIGQVKSSTDPAVKQVAPLVVTPEYQLQRLASLTGARTDDPIDPIAELDRLETSLSALMKGQDPFSGERGEIERAYRATDGTLVPYRLYVPKRYDGAEPRPLVILLHGALGNERTYFSDLYDPDLVKGEAEKRGWIFAAPSGRGRFSGYRGNAAEDVFEVINAVKRYYRIDPARTYLTGHSMGGAGTWSIAAERPDIFAAMAPVSGGGPVQGDTLNSLLERVKTVPALIVHGRRDGIVPVERSRSMAEAAKKAGMQTQYLEIADADHVAVVAASFTAVLDFFDGQTKGLSGKPASEK
jgi:poly(3-hydroxybutyrate) depolymerase